MERLREHLGLYLLLVLGVQVAVAVAQAMTPVPDDLLGAAARPYWEGVLRAALEGLSSGMLAAVSVVAAAAGIEVRAARRTARQVSAQERAGE
jgi:hypothetical protein